MLEKKRCRSLKGRKAQLAAFIIIGILILAMAGIFFYIRSSAKKSEAEKIVERGLEVTLDEAKIKEYVSACIRKEGKDLADKISEQGGTLNLEMFRYYFNVKYNYFCISEGDSTCLSRMITRQSMAQELNIALGTKLKECVNLENFRKQGYTINEEEIDIRTTIGINDVNFEVIYPITISKEGQSVAINDFSADVDSLLGTLYDLAVSITYDESTKSNFDEERWMLDYSEISIEKHRPYPDIIYSLKTKNTFTRKDEMFNFALNGRYTIFDIGKPSEKKSNRGYCKTNDNNCYSNVNQEQCVKSGGEYRISSFQTEECTGLSTFALACEGEECKNCKERKHGESWCEYEGLTSPGFSLVGSRHYKGSCIDGKIYYTECRDYREEICIENDMIEVPKAVCRVNRWQDCAKQKAKESCGDNSERDCYWADWLVHSREGTKISEITNPSYTGTVKEVSIGIGVKTGKCIPYIPPGFAHWQMNGNDVCARANDQFDCNYYTCGQSWVDSSALYCYFMGDCGNYRNVEGELSSSGFFNFDSAPSDYVYLTDEQLEIKTSPRLKMKAESIPELDGNEYNNPNGDFNQLLNNQVKYMDEVANWRFEDFRYTYITEGKVYGHVLQTSFCMPWQAPYKGKTCRECGSPNRPCTEYKCRSLGQTCTYEEVNGIGFCYDYSEKDDIPPKLFYDGSTFGDTEIKPDFFGKIKGYRITKPLEPYYPVFFMLNATEPVRCKTISVPGLRYDLIPMPSSPTFENFYIFTDIVQKPIDYRIGIMESLGVENFLELGTFESYDTKFKRILYDARKFVKEFSGALDKEAAVRNLDRIEALWNDEVSPRIKQLFDDIGDTLRDLAIQTQQSNKLIFFKCVDKAGNENEEEIFLKYKMGRDVTAPVPMWVIPLNNTEVEEEFAFNIVVNEPATCRFARKDMGYDAMPLENELECVIPVNIGLTRGYECNPMDVKASEGSKTELYVRCRDNPATPMRYKFNLTIGNKLSHTDAANAMSTVLDDKEINLTIQWEKYFRLPDVKEITVEVPENDIIINSVGDEISCRYSLKPDKNYGRMESMECEQGDSEIVFQCSESFNVVNNQYVEIACMKKFEQEQRNANRDSIVIGYSNLP